VRTQESEESPKEAGSGKAKGSKPHAKEAAAEASFVIKDTEMAEAEQPSKGTEDIDAKDAEGAGKGTKRPAEEEGSAEKGAPVSLTVAPSAKRQKTDAEWGGLLTGHRSEGVP